MSPCRTVLAAIAAMLSLSGVARAQRDSFPAAVDSGTGLLTCPAAGVVVESTPGGGAPAAPAAPGAPARAGAVRDTTITLAITDRTWTRRDVDVGVALGVSGPAGTRAAPWRACAGAAAHLGTVTAHLHNVNGTIRLHADPGALGAVRQPPSDSSRRTPPAVPPRR